MAQTSVTTDNEVKYAGRDVYPNVPRELMSRTVGESTGLDFGLVVKLAGGKIYKPRSNRATMALSGVLVTSNVFNSSVVVNGATTALTATTFATDHATSMAAIAAKYDAVPGIASATVSGNNIVLVADPETDIYITSAVVTLGAGQATATLTNTESASFDGVTVFSHLEPDSTGAAKYRVNETATVGGDIYVDARSDDALTEGAVPFVRFYDESASAADKAAGMLMATAGTSGGITRAKQWDKAVVYNGCSAGGFATLRVRK